MTMRRSWLAMWAVVLAIALSASLLAGATEGASAKSKKAKYSPPAGATFNRPNYFGNSASHFAIVRTVENAIRHVRKPTKANPYPTITIAAFLFDRVQSANALIAACKRGVGVRLILDRAVENRTQRRLFKALNADNVKKRKNGKWSKPKSGPCGTKLKKKKKKKKSGANRVNARGVPAIIPPTSIKNVPKGESPKWGGDRSYAMKCSGSCRGVSTGNMHSKFYLFSKSGSAKNVVMVSSSNLNAGGAKAGWNDLYVIKNRPKLYKQFMTIHRAMTKQLRATTQRIEFRDGPYVARFFPMRYQSKQKDPTMVDLNKIKCSSGFGKTQIYISMFYWAGKRGAKLANKIVRLARQGCQVRIVIGAPTDKIMRILKGKANISVYDTRWQCSNKLDEDGHNPPEVRTHGKYVAVKGNYDGNKKAYVVMTGSANFVGGTLTVGDEVSLNIEKASAYRAYVRNWTAIRNNSKEVRTVRPCPIPID
ncbi:MAG: phospholipase D-like domain-containing protein [Nocardioidaceae bacterium]